MKAVILISGRGSNMAALLKAGLPVEFAAVISNRPDAKGLETARSLGVATAVVDHRGHADRTAFDAILAAEIDRHTPDLVILAGFMRVLTADFVRRYQGRMINIHPALLPAFPGLDTHARALAAGVRVHGCTVHFVTPEVDVGPIIIQAAVPVLADDTEASLAARVLEQEHRVYAQAVRWFAEGRLTLGANGAVAVAGASRQVMTLISPPLDAR
ncbi:MAG: phosphoribosylglycinamide formyltransferase [Hydrogenophilaceae bacterium CG1_02_62_390]|nr:phosphoribosylglycinamide formyltransferase [Betaproteobacteria bacterium]OIO79683.1 MAG: phosphoribosylglycinamide formyltransferase [Hydrogenophilaceae bacterium CG1_02_62_390]PIW38918.1 MAG: phosphoribosylglycinamide formyltransferase [Hydrogenophilales bacterium CG15_BIG_FIL_POST_REV_8_21_14_020_62_31]PIW71508.1 MAG: phosphoribosylglycinamide formyltransferase [Hydrogenophilales bacterium CG12_big_fil_rev_8_21_14_0_65_61_21]PIX02280.1 MAG: phosphoribosylglycinamide formyltransferase [Hyd